MKAIKHKMWHFGSLLRARRRNLPPHTHIIFKIFEILQKLWNITLWYSKVIALVYNHINLVLWHYWAYIIEASYFNSALLKKEATHFQLIFSSGRDVWPHVRKGTCLSYYCRKAICQSLAVLAWWIPLVRSESQILLAITAKGPWIQAACYQLFPWPQTLGLVKFPVSSVL